MLHTTQVIMGWLFYTLLLVCCFSVKADETPTWEELNELNGKLEKVESGLSTDNRLKRIEKPPAPTTTTVYRDCQDAYIKGQTTSGVYTISPDGTTEIDVYCEQELDNGGWIVFQRRMDGTVDFNMDWQTYKQGFGNLSGEHWLGNENIYKLTAEHDQKLKVVLQDGQETAIADYSTFWIENENSSFMLNVGGFSGASPPGDSLGISGSQGHNGQQFSTYDKDNDKSRMDCSEYYSSGWWFNRCYYSNLNAAYHNTGPFHHICWRTWKGFHALSGTQMMFKGK